VHPGKLEVKFSNDAMIFHAVYYAVKDALSAANIYANPQPDSVELITAPELPRDNGNAQVLNSDVPSSANPYISPKYPQRSSIMEAFLPAEPMAEQDNAYAPFASSTVLRADISAAASVTEPVPQTKTRPDWGVLRILGEVYLTYIVVETEPGILFIDKHAAHERIIYESLSAPAGEMPSQPLLEPLALELNDTEREAILAEAEMLRGLGLYVREAESGICIDEVPAVLADINCVELVRTLAEKLVDRSPGMHPGELLRLAASKGAACRRAMKAGDIDDPAHIAWLVERLLGYEDIFFCPHGRPVCFLLAKRSIEREIGR
jgi:DNA mismatch repair protein MutL